MRIKTALILFCAVLGGVCLGQAKQSPDQQVIRFVERYDNALEHKDLAVVERMLVPNYVYFTSHGGVTSRRGLLDELLSPTYLLASSERSEIKVFRTQNTAVVSSRWKGRGSSEGKEFNDDQRCSIVLSRGKQGWQVLAEHCTQITP